MDSKDNNVAFSEQKKFNCDEVTNIIKEVVDNSLADSDYSHSKVPTWNANIIESCMNRLKIMNKNSKYIVTCVILQNKGAGFYAGSSVYWDNQNDGCASYRYESKTLYAIVNVFALCV